MDVTGTIGELQHRFLRPPRPRLRALRTLARTVDSVAALASALEGDVPWPVADRRFKTRGDPPTDAPSVLADAVYFVASAEAMDAAEAAARAFARCLWRVLSLPSEPPTVMVWQVGSWGVSPDPSRVEERLRSLRIDAWMAHAGGRVADDPGEWTEPFARMVRLVHDHARWEAARTADAALGPSPAGALIDVFRTGCALRGVDSDALRLFVPERGVGPMRAADVVRSRFEQEALDAQLCKTCLQPRSRVEDLRELVEKGADPDARILVDAAPSRPGVNWSAAAHRWHYVAVKDLRAKAFRGCPSPLHLLAWRKDTENAAAAMRYLIEAGAAPGRWTRFGNPLNFATRGYRPAPFSAAMMVQAGLPAQAADSVGRTALHMAAMRGDDVSTLIGVGVRVNTPDLFGAQPLHYALSGYPRQASVVALLEHGANPHAVDSRGLTVLHLAPKRPFLAQRFLDLGVANTPNILGVLPDLPDFVLREPTPAPDLPPGPSVRWATPPQGMLNRVRSAAAGRAEWAVLADWWMEHGDVRGELVAMDLAGAPLRDTELARRGQELQLQLARALQGRSGLASARASWFEHLVLRTLMAVGDFPQAETVLAHPCHVLLKRIVLQAVGAQVLSRVPSTCIVPELEAHVVDDTEICVRDRPHLQSLVLSIEGGPVEVDSEALTHLEITSSAPGKIALAVPALQRLALRVPNWEQLLAQAPVVERLVVGSCTHRQASILAATPHARSLAHLDLGRVELAVVHAVAEMPFPTGMWLFATVPSSGSASERADAEAALVERGFKTHLRVR